MKGEDFKERGAKGGTRIVLKRADGADGDMRVDDCGWQALNAGDTHENAMRRWSDQSKQDARRREIRGGSEECRREGK
eukprot:503523-Hanusia_phi.AAC.1